MTFNQKDGLFSRKFDLGRSDFSAASSYQLLVDLLAMSINTSFDHDQYLQGVLNQPIVLDQQIWVLTQYYIQIFQLPENQEEVTIQTRIVDANRFFVTRYFTISSENDLFVELYAQFAVIDFVEREVVRLDIQPLTLAQVIDTEKSFKFPRIGKNKTENIQETYHYSIQAGDIDKNAHVNNLVYLRWCFRALQNSNKSIALPNIIQVKYGKEILPEHEVSISLATSLTSLKALTFFTITNESTQEEACLVNFIGNNVEEDVKDDYL